MCGLCYGECVCVDYAMVSVCVCVCGLCYIYGEWCVCVCGLCYGERVCVCTRCIVLLDPTVW